MTEPMIDLRPDADDKFTRAQVQAIVQEAVRQSLAAAAPHYAAKAIQDAFDALAALLRQPPKS